MFPSQYRVEVAASAAKEFRSLPDEVKHRISVAIDNLCQNPRTSGVYKLKGHTSLYRIRVGVYRIVYEIDDEARLVRITRIRHRRDVYQ